MSTQEGSTRSVGLLGATGIGVGAIVGGGILALAGVAFGATGPSAILAFALNGIIALITALSFAQLASRFPESGGTYTIAKKVMSIETAFVIGWIVWFASIVAGVLYAFEVRDARPGGAPGPSRSLLRLPLLFEGRPPATRLVDDAGATLAHAIVGVDIDYEVLGKDNGMLMVVANGTAVKLG